MGTLNKYEDNVLISQLQNDEIEAFNKLFLKYSSQLFHFAFSLLKNREDSKEIVQEAFLRIWKNRHEIDNSKSFKSFLFTISYNLIIDQLRIRLKDKNYKIYLQEHFNVNNIKMNHSVDLQKLTRKIDSAVEELPKRRKEIYTLSREKGLSQKEIAKHLGITVKTVENQITLSLKHIKLRLGNDLLPAIFFFFLF